MKQSFFILFFVFISFSVFAQEKDSTLEKIFGSPKELFEITALTKMADSDKYGFTGEFPVKVGTGKRGGPYNQRAYLELLRDGRGKPVEYKRVGGGCCPYKSENALFGDFALVDSYEIKYKDKDGKKKKAIIYISFYDYEEPMIPVGFQSASTTN
jgi:hypothetical protein